MYFGNTSNDKSPTNIRPSPDIITSDHKAKTAYTSIHA